MVGGESIRPPAVNCQTDSPVSASTACTLWASPSATNSFPSATTGLLSLSPNLFVQVRFKPTGRTAVDTHFKENNYLEPIVADSGDGWEDLWIVYGLVDGQQLFSAKELTVQPGASCTLKDPGASGWTTVQGRGKIGPLDLQTPAMIRFGEETADEVFITHEAATGGVKITNTGSEPLVSLRYFGPDVHPSVPAVGDYKK